MDTNFQHLTHYIRTIINCKYTTHVAIISHIINNTSCLILNIIDIYVLDMFKTNQQKETMKYKYDEIKSHFEDFINDENNKDFIKDNIDDLHHKIFNTDYYIIGTYQAKKWLGDEVFNIIDFIKEYENDNFGSVNTDFSDPEKVVNMYVYIIGEDIVSDYRNQLENVA